MANVIETEEFTTGVYQLEVDDFVEGGENGVDNLPHKHLANRTKWLKAKVEAFVTALGGKVDKVTGKGLSENDFTDTLKAKLEGVERATDAEAGAGTDTTKYITPYQLQNGLPVANDSTYGRVKRATDTEVSDGEEATKFITPKHLKDAKDSFTAPDATETNKGIVERATDAEAFSGADINRYVTPKHLKDSTDWELVWSGLDNNVLTIPSEGDGFYAVSISNDIYGMFICPIVNGIPQDTVLNSISIALDRIYIRKMQTSTPVAGELTFAIFIQERDFVTDTETLDSSSTIDAVYYRK